MSTAPTIEVDVAVFGSGAAGLGAALVAASEGLSVALFEKADRLGGTTATSGGVAWIPGNSATEAAGYPDRLADARRLLEDESAGRWRGDLVDAYLVARADPDGTTQLVVDNASTVNPALFKAFTLRPERDFAAVSLMGTAPLVLVVNPDVPAKSVKDLVAYARANPKRLTYGSAGNGNTTQLCPEMFKLATEIDIQQIPYKGSGLAISDLVGGQVSMMFTGISAVKQFVDVGKLRALAVTGRNRSHAKPEVPTLAEKGNWNPGVGPGHLVGRCRSGKAPRKGCFEPGSGNRMGWSGPRTKAKLNAMSIMPVANTPEAFSQWISAEVDKYARIEVN